MHLFVYNSHAIFFPFSPLGVMGWLRLLTVVLPGLSINFFYRPEDAEGMANSVDSDQTASSRAD